MRFLTVSTLAFALVAPAVVQAEVDYNYLEIGYISTEIDTGFGDADGDGFALEGSFEVNDSYFVFGDYTSSDIEGFDFSTLALGVGYHSSTDAAVQFVARGGFARAELDAGVFGDASENGFIVSAGGRGELNEQFEWGLLLNYIDLDDSDTSLEGSVRYRFTPGFAVGASLETGDDVDIYGLQFRWLYQ